MTLRCVACGHENQPGPVKCENCGASLKGNGSVIHGVAPSAGAAVVLCVIAAVVLAGVAILQTSQVTSGPVAIGAALLFGVFARISQAGAQHREQWQWRQRKP